ncbi:MAG: CAAD domain-containing protein, partial [Cyanobacteriota bacterium]
PAQESGAESEVGEGGEWELLLSQVREWLENLKLQQTLQGLRRPLSLLGWLLALLVLLRVYSAVVGTLDRLPLVPGLLELVGVGVTVRFATTHLVRSQQRQAVLQQLSDRWKAFRG